MKTIHSLVLQKSTKEYKIEGKEYYSKRKREQFKDSFIHFPKDAVEKQKFNKFVENKRHEELRYDIKEVDPSEKSKLDWQSL